MDATGHRLAALTVGIALAGGLYWLLGTPLLSLVTGLETSVGAALFLRVWREHPAAFTGGDWQDGRWTAVAEVALVTGALVGVSPLLAIDDGVIFGLSVLVLVTGFTTYLAGYLSALDRPDPTPRDVDPGE
jgi:hypothetical protein